MIEGKEEELTLTVEVDLDEVERVRENIPVFQDRRADLQRVPATSALTVCKGVESG